MFREMRRQAFQTPLRAAFQGQRRPPYHAIRYLLGIGGLVWLCWPLAALAASGSWVASVPGALVTAGDRPTQTRHAEPPQGAAVAGAVIRQVQWRWEPPPGQAVNAWLCHPQGCHALATQRGSTRALAGISAASPLHFRFTLPAGQRPVRVQGLQVIVNYQ